MIESKQLVSQINFKLHLILFFITGTLWVPFYNLICFLRLNKLAKLLAKQGITVKRNVSIGQFLLTTSFIGAPIAFFRRYQLLRNYIAKAEPILGEYTPKEESTSDENNEKQIKRPINIKPSYFIGYAITTFLILALLVTSFTLSIYHLIVNPSWGSDALMILFPIGMGSIFTTLGFSVRTAKEEKLWVEAFNNIIDEVVKIEN